MAHVTVIKSQWTQFRIDRLSASGLVGNKYYYELASKLTVKGFSIKVASVFARLYIDT